MNDSSQIYFSGFERIGNNNDNSLMASNINIQNSRANSSGEKIKLVFSIKNSRIGSKYSLQAKLYYNQAIDYNSEEKENYFGPDFTFKRFLVCDYLFNKKQELIITLYKNNSPINIKTTLKYIIDSKENGANLNIVGNEYLNIKAEKTGEIDKVLNIKFSLKNEQNPNYFVNNKIKFVISANNTTLFSSSPILDNGTFESTNIPLYLLNPSYNAFFYDLNDRLLGIYYKTIDGIVYKNDNSLFEFTMPDGTNIELYDNSEITKNFSFIDYKNAGVQIALSIGIDFTGNNGHYGDKNSLHYIKSNELNDYEKAISTCGKIVGSFDSDQIFPVYGFGAIINPSENNETSDCFNLNFKENPNISGIDNVLKLYRDCIQEKKLLFSCKANFAPLLKTVISKINEDIFEYHILMILTTGRIDDFQETINILVEASLRPLSVIIIGIGKDKFEKMIEIDGDEKPIESSTGKVRKRDLVQFVPFDKYQNDENLLFKEVLAEIPRQITEYYQFKNLNPDKIKNLISKKNGSVNPEQNLTISISREINQNSINNNNSTANNLYTTNDNSRAFIPNPFANNLSPVYNNSYFGSSIPSSYSQTITSSNFIPSETMSYHPPQDQTYIGIPNPSNFNNLFNIEFSRSYVIQGEVQGVNESNNSQNDTTNNTNNISTNMTNNFTRYNNNTSNVSNNMTNNFIPYNNNISNISNISNNMTNNFIPYNNNTNNETGNNSEESEEIDLNKLLTERTIYVPRRQ